MALKTYHPEMNEAKPDAEIEARYLYRSYRVFTNKELKGRGITLSGIFDAPRFIINESNRYKVGRKVYDLTPKAFEKLHKTHDVGLELLLD